jgi:sulfate permease, SulP family
MPATRDASHGSPSSTGMRLFALRLDALSAIITTVLSLAYSAGYGAMIFSAGLAPWAVPGMPTALVSCAAVALIISLASGVPFVIGGPDSNTTALLAPLAATVALDVHAAGGSDAEGLATVLLLIAAASVTTGLLLLALARWKRGNATQYIPFPVIGGFLAGTGLLLVLGAFRVMTDAPVSVATVRIVLQLPWLATVPAFVVGLGLLVLTRVAAPSRFVIILPSMMLAGIALFYGGLAANGITLEHARRMGLLFYYEPVTGMRMPLALLHDAWLRTLFSHAPEVLAIAAVSSMTVLLNMTSIGVTTARDIDFNHEMRAAGIANVVTGMIGGMVGTQSMTRTMTNYRLGVRGRRAGLMSALLSLVVIAACPGLIALLPKPVLVGLQFFIGAGMLIEWLFFAFKRLPWHDYLLIPAIMIIITVYGLLAGVLLGVIAACLLFVVRYGRVNCFRLEFNGRGPRSNVERTVEENRLLDENAHAIYGVALQGFLFFGTAFSILTHMRARIETAQGASTGVRFVLVDFARVHGVDASSTASFMRLRQACARAGAQLVITGLTPKLKALAESTSLSGVHEFADLDGGLEWVETQILTGSASARTVASHALNAFHTLDAMRAHLETITLAPGAYLCRQADPGDAIYFVDSGRVTVSLAVGEGRALRLRSFGAGTIVGEMAVYTGARRSADVIADEPTVALRLTVATLQRLETDDPVLAARLHKLVARVLAARLVVANEQIRAAQ